MSNPYPPAPPPPPGHFGQQPPVGYYYSPPPQRPRSKYNWVYWLLGGLLVLVVAVAAVAVSTGDEDTTSSNTLPTVGANPGGPSSGDLPATQDVYAVGETAHTGIFDVTVHQVVDPWQSDNQFETPQAGHRYVAVEASLINTEGDELETWSSLLGAELSDSQGRPWQTALAGTSLPSLDGDVGAGMARRGWVVFEVASDAAGLTLRLKGNLTATGSLFALGAS